MPAEVSQSGGTLQFGLGSEQIAQPFSLGQIDAAIGEGAAGELARFGSTGLRQRRQRCLHRGNHRAATMAVELGQILTGRRVWARNHSTSASSSKAPAPSRSFASEARRGAGTLPAKACKAARA